MTRTCSWCGAPNGEHTASCFDRQRVAARRTEKLVRKPPGPWLTVFAIALWISVGILLAQLI